MSTRRRAHLQSPGQREGGDAFPFFWRRQRTGTPDIAAAFHAGVAAGVVVAIVVEVILALLLIAGRVMPPP